MKSEDIQKNGIKVFPGKEIEGFLDMNRPFKPDYYAFLLIREGELEVRYKLTTHILKSGSVLLINSQIIYEFVQITNPKGMMLIILEPNFQLQVPTSFSKLDTIFYFATSSIVHLTFSEEEFMPCWQLVNILNNKSKAQNYRFKNNLTHTLFASVAYMLIERIGEVEAQQSTSENRSDLLTREFIRLLQIHFREHHNISFYAERLNISTKHLSETLKKVTGHTGKDLINNVLIRESKMLLADKNLKVATIAERLHFSDQFAFSKFFKRMTRHSPTAYSKNHS